MFADNQRISHRQLFRQMVLSMIAPFLLLLTGKGNIKGINAIAEVLIIALFLGFYVILLVRLGPAYEHLLQCMGKIQGRIIVAIYILYIWWTAAYLLQLLAELAGTWLLTGVKDFYIRLAVAAVCALGSHQGMEKRARMGEVSFWLVVGGILLLIILAFSQKNLFSIKEFTKSAISSYSVSIGCFQLLCGFLPITLLPFLLNRVKRSASTKTAIWGGIFVLCGLLVCLAILLPISLGWDRMVLEKMPVLPLLAGTNLPGDVLARFDVVWISLLIYGLLYSIGSLFYYGSYLSHSATLPIHHWIQAAVVLGISGMTDHFLDVYREFMEKFGIPVLFLIPVYVSIIYRRRQA